MIPLCLLHYQTEATKSIKIISQIGYNYRSQEQICTASSIRVTLTNTKILYNKSLLGTLRNENKHSLKMQV